MVDTGATLHLIKDMEKFLNFDDSFQVENYFIDLADGTSDVAVKRGWC